MAARGIKILEVEAGSEAEGIGLRPGDRILTVNGHEVPDELALRFYLSEEHVDLCIRRLNGRTKWASASG
jgi:S1-C subfamily serine protease